MSMAIPIEIAAACLPNGGMGSDNRLPWDCKEDMRYFSKLTTNHTVIMGRKTWESLHRRPLPRRINIVVSSTLQPSEMPTGVLLARSLKDALELVSVSDGSDHDHRRVFIIGGARLFQEAMEHPACALAHVTEIHESCANHHDDCDIFFPLEHLNRFFELQTQTDGERCIFRAYTRRRNSNQKN